MAKCREFFPYPSELDASINMYVLQMTPESEHNHDEVNAVLAELLQTAS